MRFDAHIICWNEAQILPHVLRYWQMAGVDKLYVHDNHSTDRTLEMLGEYPFVTVVPYDSAEMLDDYILRDIKESCWRDSDADWVFVGDCDEVPFAALQGGVWSFLDSVSEDVAVIQPCGYQVLAWSFPSETGLLHIHPDVRVMRLGGNKTNLFRPRRVERMNYELGAHVCDPVCAGRVEYRDDICWLHLKNLGVEYLVQRNRQLYARLPEKVRWEKLIAVHYLPGSDYRNVAADMAGMWEQARPWYDFGNL